MSAEQQPLLRLVKGTPDDHELAALTAVIAGLASAAPAEDDKPVRRSEWANHARRVRAPLQHGPGAWRASGLPG